MIGFFAIRLFVIPGSLAGTDTDRFTLQRKLIIEHFRQCEFQSDELEIA